MNEIIWKIYLPIVDKNIMPSLYIEIMFNLSVFDYEHIVMWIDIKAIYNCVYNIFATKLTNQLIILHMSRYCVCNKIKVT